MGGLGGRTEKGGRIAGTCPEDRRDGCRIAGDGESPGLRVAGSHGPAHGECAPRWTGGGEPPGLRPGARGARLLGSVAGLGTFVPRWETTEDAAIILFA